MLRRLLCLLGLLAIAACAQTAPAPPPREVKTYRLPPEKLKKAIDYANARYRLHFIDVGYGWLVLVGVLALGIAPRIRNWAERISRRRITQAYLFVVPLILVTDIVQLPSCL